MIFFDNLLQQLNQTILLETNYGKLEGTVVSIVKDEDIEGYLIKIVLEKPLGYPVHWYDTKIGMRWKESVGSLANAGRNTNIVSICYNYFGTKLWNSPTFLHLLTFQTPIFI